MTGPAIPETGSMPSLHSKFQALLATRFAAWPDGPAVALVEADLAHLPAPVQRYLHRAGAVGRPRPRNFRVEFDARMWSRPGARPMRASSVQFNFLDDPARLFLMKARMFGLPVAVLHAYLREQATMQVRVAGLLDLVDLSGDVLSVGETITVLNDMCFFAPGALVDSRLSWESVGERTVKVTFTNGRRRGGATLFFDEQDDLRDFSSDDRPALQPDGTLRASRWSTPVEGYHDLDGRRVLTLGRAVYHYPEGDFTYGEFTLRSLALDVVEPPTQRR